jgi:GST-like protein
LITLFSKATSNGRKASIMLEETGLAYRVIPIDLAAGEQKQPWFLEINPQGRIPAIHDDDGPDGRAVTLFESGAILVYLGEKSGKFLPAEARARAEVMKWLMYASTHITFTGMQVHWQVRERDAGRAHPLLGVWKEENERVYGAVHLGLSDGRRFLSGDDYSIADIAAYPWIYRHEMQEIDLGWYPRVHDWFARIAGRPAVRRGLDVPPRDDNL